MLAALGRRIVTAGSAQTFGASTVGVSAAMSRSAPFGSAGPTKEEVTEQVLETIKAFKKVDASKLTPQSHFVSDLGLDSLDTVDLVVQIEEDFGILIPDSEAEKIFTAEDAVNYVMNASK